MIIGIRVDSENIRTGEIKHCNSSYFTMVAKDDDKKNVSVLGVILFNHEEIRRFYNCIKLIALKKHRSHQ
jgi:acyl-CoA hydrolase